MVDRIEESFYGWSVFFFWGEKVRGKGFPGVTASPAMHGSPSLVISGSLSTWQWSQPWRDTGIASALDYAGLLFAVA